MTTDPARRWHPSVQTDTALRPALDLALSRALDGAHRRITRIEAGGQVFWLKRVEQHATLRWRLQKGDPAAGFAAELAAHRRLIALDAPVPPLLADGPGWALTGDAGPTLEQIAADPQTAPEDLARTLEDAARTLAAFHARGWRHGRPKLRDMCQAPDGRIVLIDFERFHERASAGQRGLDATIFAHSLLETLGGDRTLFARAMAAYRQAAPGECWDAAQRAARRWNWLKPLLLLAAWWRPDRPEVQAMAALPAAMRF